jgi:hypothetical protein
MKMNRYNLLIMTLIYILMLGSLVPAQEIDQRIWSLTYWQKLAEKGLVTVTSSDETSRQVPQVPNSRIYARSVLTDDSPDVPVTTATNVTQSETSIFINPNDDQKVLNSNNSSDLPVTTIFGASYWMSDDAGLTWSGSPQGAGGSQRGDPATAIDLSGRYYIGYIAANSGNGCAYSTNEGQTWTHVQVAPNPGSLADKNHLWVDDSPSSPYEGNLYAAWTDFGGANDGDVVLSRSTDGGLTWSAFQNVSNGLGLYLNQGVNIQTGPNGEVYVVWVIYDTSSPLNDKAIGFTKSLDGGVTWSTPLRLIDNILGIRAVGLGGGKTMRVNSFPSMTVNQNNGNIYVTWTNVGVPGVNTGDPDIYVIKSTDGGSTWETPVRANQDPIGNGKDQWQSWIACDPSTGFLVCIFYDSRNFAANDQAETFVAASTDDGNTWEDFKVSDVSWNGDGFPGFASNYAGDYIGIDILNGKVYPVWADVRGGQLNAWVSPFLLADPNDPNPPSNFDAYSDYTTPTSIELTWADPTSLANGDTLLPSDFQIHILRDNVEIDSVAGGTEQYTDNGLTNGILYTYTLFAKILTNDSTSLSVNTSWHAGGAPTPNGPTAFFLTNESGGQLMAHWTNPTDNVDGTPMDDFDAINLYEDGSLLTTFTRSSSDTGSADSALFTPGGTNLPYYATAVDNESPPNESSASNTAYPPFIAPYSQNFETGGVLPVQWTNESDDDIDWTPDAGGTPSASTGPTVDHTLGTAAGYYLYTEASSPNFPNMTAHLTTPFIDMGTVSNPGMAFWYHMYGQSMGDLHVDVYANGIWNLDVMPPLIGQQQLNQTDPWLQAVVDLSAYAGAPIQVRFRGITGTNFYSDMAIDDVFFGSLDANPQMVVTPQSINDTLLVGAISPHKGLVSNVSLLPTVLNYTVTEDPPVSWLSVLPTSGTVTSGQSDTLNVTLDATGLTSGFYNTELIVAGNDSTNMEDTIAITLQVNDAPLISIAPDTFDVTVASGSTELDTLTIRNDGLGPLYFTVGSGQPTKESMKNNKPRVAKVDEASLSPEILAAIEQRSSQTGVLNARDESEQVKSSGGFMLPDQIQGEEIFGSTANPFSGGLRDRGNIFSVATATTLIEHKFYLTIPVDDQLAFFVYEGTAVTGTYNKINEVDFTNSGTGEGFYSSGSINVPLEVGFYYYIGAAWPTSASNTYYRGSESTPLPASFGMLETGIPGNIAGGYPPAATANNTYSSGGYSPYYCAIVTGAGVDWITPNPASGQIPPGDSLYVELTFDPTGLLGGDYYADVVVNSNDPINPELRVGAHMFVEAEPDIAVAPDSVIFETPVIIGLQDTLSLTVHNNGAGVLDVTNIASSNSVFSVSATNFTVPALDSVNLDVAFAPITAGSHTGTLTITSNDPDSPTLDVYVEGDGIDAPAIAVSPDTFDVTLAVDSITTQTMTIHNNGAGPLDFQVVISGDQPELMYYKFNEVGASQTENFAASGTPVPAMAGVLGGLTMGGSGYEGAALIGSGGSSSTDYVDTGWITNISGSWTISMWLSGTWPSAIAYVFGDITAQSFRCFTAGAAGVNGLLLRSPNGAAYDVQLNNVGPGTAVVDYVYDDAALELRGYVNGVLMATVPQSAPIVLSGTAVFKIAGYSTSGGLAAGMLMDEWKWYTRAIDVESSRSGFWLSADTASGIVAPGDSLDITLTFDATGLTGGDYDAEILVKSNDPAYPEVGVGVHMFVEDSVTSIAELNSLPTTFAISQNYPNPFNPSTTFNYQLPKVADVKLIVYNILGQKVRTLISHQVEPGYHTAEWNGLNDAGRQAASGIYIYRFEAGDFVKTMKMMMLK